MTDARPGNAKREPTVGADPAAPHVDPRTFDHHEDLVGDGMSLLPVVAGLLVAAAIVTGMFMLAA